MIKHNRPDINKGFRASYTVEAAFLMPLFAIIMTVLLLIFRIFEVQWGLGVSAWQTAEKMAVCGDVFEDGGVINETAASLMTTATTSANDVSVNYLAGNLLGLFYSDSVVDDHNVDIVVRYRIPLPVGYRLFDHFNWKLISHVKTRRWVGYDPHEGDGCGDDLVYVTANGTVYHDNINCTYLAPSVHSTSVSRIGSLRSKDGRIYHPCERCGGGSGTCYYTDYGSVYHSDLLCSSLKRNIRCMKRSEAEKMYPPCSKCGGSGSE